MKRLLMICAISFLAIVSFSCKQRTTTDAPGLLGTAEQLAGVKASLEQVISSIGEPTVQSTNQSGDIILQYVLNSGMEEEWKGKRCGGVTFVVAEGKIKEIFPILTNN